MSQTCPSVECCNPSPFSYELEPTTPPYWNVEQTATAACPQGYIGDPTSATVAAHMFYSYTSQAAADALALAEAQREANLALDCVPPVYWNTEQCASCPLPSTEQYCVPAGSYSSTVSQAAADAEALAVATANLSCNIAGQLNGLRWEMPAITQHNNVADCVDPADQVETLTGTPGTLYQVTIRLRGVVEQKNYINGTVDAAALAYSYGPALNPTWTSYGGAFQTGGIVDPGYNAGANEYSLIVSDPAETYWLNRRVHVGWESRPVMLDYTETIPMRAGATVTLRARSKDNSELANITYPSIGYSQITVPGLTNLLPNVGQWIEMSIISVT